MQPTYIVHGVPDSILILGGIAVLVIAILGGVHYFTSRSLRKIEYAAGRTTYDQQQYRSNTFEPLFNHPNRVL